MKVGVIGAGVWGKNLVNNFAELGVLHAVADAVESNQEWVREHHAEVRIFESAEELFQVGGIDAVAIATPPHTHYAIALAAMERGLDVFVEKPMTLDPEEAKKMAAYAEENDRILMIGHLLMYQPAIAFIKEYLEAGKLGKVYTMTQRRSKLGRVRAVENVLWSFGVHDVAVLLYLAGEEPTKVVGSGHAGISQGVADDFHLHLTFGNGVVANLHNSWLWPRVERELIVTGEKGMLVFDELNSKVFFHQKTVDSDLVHHDEGGGLIYEGSSQPLRIELEHFVECCQNHLQPKSGSANGVACVKVLASV